jgi:hypothetical protein
VLTGVLYIDYILDSTVTWSVTIKGCSLQRYNPTVLTKKLPPKRNTANFRLIVIQIFDKIRHTSTIYKTAAGPIFNTLIS